MARNCDTFSADVGIDDVTTGSGSVVFQVWADGEEPGIPWKKLWDSDTMVASSGVKPVQVTGELGQRQARVRESLR